LVKKEIPNEVVFIGIPDESLGQKLMLIIEGDESEGVKKNFRNSFEKISTNPKKLFLSKKFQEPPMEK
jgi:O-succinylbenzoic acid--CoA ligase